MVKEQLKRSTLVRLGICAAIVALGWVVPAPAGITPDGWHLVGIFVATIASFLIKPFGMGPMVLLALVTLAVTRTVEFEFLLREGYGDETVWLVVAAFLIAGTVTRTGFGKRIALLLVTQFGKSMLGLGYAQCGAELMLGPVVPSNTARGGGILAPIALSLARSLKSEPNPETRDRAGAYLVLVGAHANLITAAMFLTGMAANPIVANTAGDVFGIEFGWGRWALGALVPGLVGLGLLPLWMHLLSPPKLKSTTEAQEQARQELDEMGALSRNEKITGGVFVLLLVLWSTEPLHGMSSSLVAWIGVLVLQLTEVDTWDDIKNNAKAWDCLVWLGGLLAMAKALNDLKVIEWFAASMQTQVAGLSGLAVVVALGLIYFYSMYGFSMLTAHISAMVAAFIGVALAAGAPPLVTVAVFAYFSTLCGCTTYYSTGPVIIYFGLGYVEPGKWFRIGFLMSLFHLVIWLGVGLVWWKLIGWW